MLKNFKLSLVILLLGSSAFAKAQIFEPLSIPSTDGLEISAELYPSKTKPAKGVILLCHQANWSRGEYRETGLWLSQLGFHSIAMDQRSGGSVNGVVNTIAESAKAKGLKISYIDAKPDIEAALIFLRARYKQKIILLGSSYSAALTLRIAGEKNLNLRAGIAFSPGEYFPDKRYLQNVLAKISIPTFVTASKAEMKKNVSLWDEIPKAYRSLWTPSKKGHHGSRALWTEKKGHQEYRKQLQTFLFALLN